WETFYSRTLSHLSSKSKPNATPTPTAPQDNDPSNAPSSPPEDSEDEGEDDDSDPGTSWFSEHNAPDKVLSFLTDESFPFAPSNTLRSGSSSKGKKKGKGKKGKALAPSKKEKESQPSILDLGTGNGSMLALLRKKGGFRGEMVGVDYSERSIVLARELQRFKGHSAYLSDSDSDSENGRNDGEEEDDVVVAAAPSVPPPGTAEALPVVEEGQTAGIRFEVWDILSSTHHLRPLDQIPDGEKLDWFPYDKGGFDIVLDKGTFDAVSLSEDTDPQTGKRVCEKYPPIAKGLVRKGGFLIVTSCNWTEEELIKWFTGDGDGKDGLRVWGRV
ncbi:S-adenosylmethionine-dependent methyltransferase, partial [Aspergillus sclerotialis]